MTTTVPNSGDSFVRFMPLIGILTIMWLCVLLYYVLKEYNFEVKQLNKIEKK